MQERDSLDSLPAIHSESDANYCSRCKVITPDIKLHCIAKHPELYCKACTRIFETKADIGIHYRDSLKHAACTLCSVSFDTAQQYERHVTIDHIVRDAGAHCLPCDKYYKTVTVLKEHVKTVHGQGSIQSGAYFPQYVEEAVTSGGKTSGSQSSNGGITDLENTTPLAQTDDVRDKVIPATRDTSPASMGNEGCALPDASPVYREGSLPTGEVESQDDGKGRPKVASGPPDELERRFERKMGYPSSEGDARSSWEDDDTGSTPSPGVETLRLTPMARASTLSGVGTSTMASKNLSDGRENRSSIPSRAADPPASTTFVPSKDASEPRRSTAAFFACKICEKMPADPVVTICGHLFCHGCIMAELSKKLCCPVCNRIMLVRLRQ